MNYCAYKFSPIKDESGKVIKTNFFCACDYDIGGSDASKWLQVFGGDAGIIDSMIKFNEGMKDEKLNLMNEDYKKNLGETNENFVEAHRRMKAHQSSNKLDSAVEKELFALHH